MNQNEKALFNELKSEIATHKKTLAIAGFFLSCAFVAIPASALIGSKIVGIAAICWIFSFLLTCSAIDATKKMEQATEKLDALKLTVAMEEQQNPVLQSNSFFSIGMN
jgi:hypothetical protein